MIHYITALIIKKQNFLKKYKYYTLYIIYELLKVNEGNTLFFIVKIQSFKIRVVNTPYEPLLLMILYHICHITLSA